MLNFLLHFNFAIRAAHNANFANISPMCQLRPFSLLFATLLLAPATYVQSSPKSSAKLPPAVAAQMPERVLDIATYRVAPAPGAPQFLIHLWCAPRRDPAGGGTFGAPPGQYKGEISREEAASFSSLYPSPFVYDIFAPDGKGGWNYQDSIIRNDTSTPATPTMRYLNNKTKTGYIIQIGQFGGQYIFPYTLYIFTDWGYPYSTREMANVRPPARSGGKYFGFGRDARGYAQIITAVDSYDEATDKYFETRTISNWDEQAGDWKAGQPRVVQK